MQRCARLMMGTRIALGRPVMAAALALGELACLPADTRPEPALVLVDAELPSDLAQAAGSLGFATEDGWTVAVDRLLVSMGRLRMNGSSCNPYSDAWYLRILDMLQPGPQRVGQLWALHDCDMSFGAGIPDEDSVLGAGVSEDDRAFMQRATVPSSSREGPTTTIGMAVHIAGSAAKDGQTVRFDWGFSDRRDWTQCQRRTSSGLERRLPLSGGATTRLRVVVDPRRLFGHTGSDGTDPGADAGAPGGMWWMQRIADADRLAGDGNGQVSIDELWAMEAPDGTPPGPLAEQIRLWSYPAMFRYDEDGECASELRDDDGQF